MIASATQAHSPSTASWPETLAAASLGAATSAALASTRTFLTFDVETDTIATFVRNAQEVLAGGPVHLGFHGPLYPILLAATHLVVSDWFTAGLVLSCLSAAFVAGASFALYTELFGRPGGWASVAGLCTSRAFLTYGAFASSDLVFLALASASLLVAQRSIRAASGGRWALLGFVLGLLLLTRTNGLAYLVLLLAPWCVGRGSRAALGHAARIAVALALPLAAWLAVAYATGSTPLPVDVQSNLASTYFAPTDDRESGDAIDRLHGRFGSAFEVIAEDPRHVAETYVRDLATLVRTDLGTDTLLAFPLYLLALPGLVAVFLGARWGFTALLLVVIAGQVAFVNLRTFDTRFNLFLVPFLGACAGVCVARMAQVRTDRWRRALVGGLLVALLLLGARSDVVDAYAALHAQDAELGEALPALEGVLEPGCGLVARKPHLAFYTGSQDVFFPDVRTAEELERSLRDVARAGPVYLYYGSAERAYRPSLDALARPEEAPPWLVLRARGRTPGTWALYQVRMN